MVVCSSSASWVRLASAWQRCQVAVEIGEPHGVGAVVEAALLAVDDRETALDAQAASPWGCLGR
jgi:hypothetical protein